MLALPRRLVEAVVSLLFLASASWSAGSLACSFAIQEEECRGLRFHPQGATIPLNAASTSMTLEWGLSQPFEPWQRLDDGTFPDRDEIEVRLHDGEQSGPIDFALVRDPVQPPGVRRLVFVDPTVGEYSIRWTSGTCADQSAASVTIGAPAPVPGPIEASPNLFWLTEPAGDDVCGSHHGPQGSLEVELPLNEEWRPWRHVLTHTLRVGSEQTLAYGLITQASGGDGLAFRGGTPFACGADNPNDLPHAPFGGVDVAIELTANGTLRTSPATPYQMPCPVGGGCRCVTSDGGLKTTLPLTAIFAIGLLRLRPRARRTRPRS